MNYSISIQAGVTSAEVSEASEVSEFAEVKEDSYCQITLGGLKAWGNCSDGCFDDLNSELYFVIRRHEGILSTK